MLWVTFNKDTPAQRSTNAPPSRRAGWEPSALPWFGRDQAGPLAAAMPTDSSIASSGTQSRLQTGSVTAMYIQVPEDGVGMLKRHGTKSRARCGCSHPTQKSTVASAHSEVDKQAITHETCVFAGPAIPCEMIATDGASSVRRATDSPNLTPCTDSIILLQSCLLLERRRSFGASL